MGVKERAVLAIHHRHSVLVYSRQSSSKKNLLFPKLTNERRYGNIYMVIIWHKGFLFDFFLKGKDKVKESLSLLKSEIAILPTTSFCKRKDLSWVPTEFNLPPSSKWYGNVYFRKHGNGFLKTCLDTHKEFRTLKWSTIKKFIRICLQGYFPWMSKHNLKLFGAAIFFVSIQRLLRQNSNFCQLHFLHEIFLWQPVNAFLLYGKTDITSLLPYFQLCLGKGMFCRSFAYKNLCLI